MNRQIEILAPAGSYEGMKAAMNAGCDAVYIGGSNFGARAYAKNLDEETMSRAIDETHIRNKRLYLTVNTLIREKELTEQLYSFLEGFYLQGLDAVIVQDVGILHFIHQHFPKLPIHASTQMTLTMAQGANLLKDAGVTRLVTSRELSLKEIRTIRDNTDMEIETFVHGALCYSYSGQCLMSSIIGGRSGNRGRCAQPCRMPYQFYKDGKLISSDREKYLLSPKDINTVSMIPELIEAGIDSFKIEGRMKRPEYAAAVSSTYRRYVDLYFTLGKEKYDELIKGESFTKDMTKLSDIYNRGGFSEGYGKTYNGRKMMSLNRPNHSGVYVGDVTEVKGSQVAITLKEDINPQDILEIRDREEEGYEFTVKDAIKHGEVLRTNVGRRPIRDQSAKETSARETVTKWSPEPMIHIGNWVYRTKNNELLERITSEYLDKDQKLGMKGILKVRQGERLMLTLAWQNCSVTAYQDIVQAALKQPMTKEKLSAPITKTGDTLYFFEELIIDSDEQVFVPVAWLSEIRRDAIQLLQEAVVNQYRRDREEINWSSFPRANSIDNTNDMATKQFGVSIAIQTREQFEMALSYSEVNSLYVDYDFIPTGELPSLAKAAMNANKELYLMLPYISRLAVYDRLKKDILTIADEDGIKGYLVKNFEEVSLLQSLMKDKIAQKEIILNHNMYVFNQEAKLFWRELGITHFTAPVELNYQELKDLNITDCDILVYGYLPLMVSAQCLNESTQGCGRCNTGTESQTGYLVDRLEMKFFVQTNCKGCYNILYNGQRLSLIKQVSEVRGLKPRNIRLDFTMETKEEIQQVLNAFFDTYLHGRESSLVLPNSTTGHFKRGVQ